MNIFSTTLYGFPLADLLLCLAIAVGTTVILLFGKRIVAARLARLASRTSTDVDDMLVSLIDSISPLFVLFVGLYVGSMWLPLSTKAHSNVNHVFFIAMLIQAGFWGSRVLAYLIAKSTRLREYENPSAQTTLSVLGFLSRLVLWSVIMLIILDNLGFDITTLLASLGIGGIAVALAAQNILGELFASLSIALDKPFVIGDFIVVDTYMGNIEKIGMRTTQIRSLGGELIIFSNTDLLKSRVRNYKRMQERRILFTLDLVYGTPYQKLERVPDMVRGIMEAEEMARFDRAHFKGYGASSLMFEFVYYVLSADYTEFMNVQQRINFAIYRKFEEEDLDFAFPTQTLHLQAAQHIEYGGDIPDSRSPAQERAARVETPPLPEEDT